MSTFHDFATRVHKRYTEMAKNELYVAGTIPDIAYAHYLASFPEGTNPIYRVNTEHDCSCCKQFIRNLGLVVSIKAGKVESVWDVQGLTGTYAAVAKSMNDYVLSLDVTSLFRSKEPAYGHESNREMLKDGSVKTWNHFHGKVAARHLHAAPAEARGAFNTSAQVFLRGLQELSKSSIEQVLDLIAGKALYRGEEHLPAVKGFMAMQAAFLKLKTARERSIFVFENASNPAARFRNTVIGTLVQDLSEGVDIEKAVKGFEAKVAPTNYKRTTALITPNMVKDAMEKVRAQGLEEALQRRLATIADISVNNVLWVDNSVRPLMKGGVEDLLMSAAKATTPVKIDKPVDIGIEEFMKKVLPAAKSVEMLVENSHLSNFMAVTAPAHPGSGKLFKWDNEYAWSYDGNITDSIREKVKRAGGDIDAKLRFSLSWFNTDDLDIHVWDPSNSCIYYANTMGHLDVDMNNGFRGPLTRDAVENVSFKAPRDGVYRVEIHNYRRRETTDIGFTIEIADGAGSRQYSYAKAVSESTPALVGRFTVKGGVIVSHEFGPGMVERNASQVKWGVSTEKLAKVKTVMFSPNYWDENAVGNKHFFFILDGCKTEEPARGIYNEFLASGFEQHRKVFEVLGDKTKCPVTEDQLAGLGFSSTGGKSVKVAVASDAGTRQFNINF